MKALVYHGPGQKSWDSVANPTIQAPTDAIVKIDTATIAAIATITAAGTATRSRRTIRLWRAAAAKRASIPAP